jgi:high frequency lysogenization protein
LFAFDANNTEAVFGGIHGVKQGLLVLCDVLNGNKRGEYRTIIRYTLGMLYLQKKLCANDELLGIMRSRLEHASLKAEHFSDDPASTATSIAAIYQDTLSTFKFRIQVSGSLQQLQNSQNADTIRALLLAGIRSAVLWRQTGGRRWKLPFSRGSLLRTATQLLDGL